MKKLLSILTLAAMLISAPAHAYTIRAAGSAFSLGNYVHNIGSTAAGVVLMAWHVIPQPSSNGEEVTSKVNFAAAADFVGSFFYLAFSDPPCGSYDNTTVRFVVPPTAQPCPTLNCKTARRALFDQGCLAK